MEKTYEQKRVKGAFIAQGIPTKPYTAYGSVYATNTGWVCERTLKGGGVKHIEKLLHFRDLDKTLAKHGFDIFGVKLVDDKIQKMNEENQRLMDEFDTDLDDDEVNETVEENNIDLNKEYVNILSVDDELEIISEPKPISDIEIIEYPVSDELQEETVEVTAPSIDKELAEESDESLGEEIKTQVDKDIIETVEEVAKIKNPVVCNRANKYEYCAGCEHVNTHEKSDCSGWHTCPNKPEDDEDFKCRCQKA